MYKASKVPLYHKKNDKHNLTKKSNFAHLDFEKSNLSLFRLLYHKYVNLYANLQIKAFISIIIKQIILIFYILFFKEKENINKLFSKNIDFNYKIYIIPHSFCPLYSHGQR